MGRAPCCDKANVKRGPWSPEEDEKLKAYIEEHGTGGNWIALPQKIGLKRCGKSCRLRWLNYLRPDIKHGGFSEEEDQTICSLYISIGSRWSIIAAQLPGRTDNDIKNYWNTRLKKKLLGRRKEPSQSRRNRSLNQELDCSDYQQEDASLQTLSPTALERMQLHLKLQGLNNPFSFYNHPTLWPKVHPLGSTYLWQDASISSEPVLEPNQQFLRPMKTVDEPLQHLPVNASMNEVFCENLNELSSVAEGINADLRNLSYGSDGSSTGQEENLNWWDANDFGDQSLSDSWKSISAFQPNAYISGYDM